MLAFLKSFVEEEQKARRRTAERRIEAQTRLNRFVDLVNPQIRCVSGWEKTLSPSVEALWAYVQAEILAKLPAVVPFDYPAIGQDEKTGNSELLRVLFAAPERLTNCLNSPDLWENGATETCALLTVQEAWKTSFGSALQKGQIIRDVQQTSLLFTNPSFLCLSPTEEGMRDAFAVYLFEERARFLKADIEEHRQSLARSRGALPQIPCGDAETPAESLRNPAIYFRALCERIKDLPQSISMRECSCKLSVRSNQLLGDNDKDASFAVVLHQLYTGRWQRVVLPVYCQKPEDYDTAKEKRLKASMAGLSANRFSFR